MNNTKMPKWDYFERTIPVNIRIRNKTFIICLVIICVIFLFCWQYLDMPIEDSLKIVAYFVGISGLWFAALGLQINFDANQGVIAQSRKSESMKIITEWYDNFRDESALARKFRIKHTNNITGVIDIVTIEKDLHQIENEEKALLRNGDDIADNKMLIRKNITPVLNYFEKISIGVLWEALDETIIREFFYDMFISYYEVFTPLIVMRRKDSDNKTPNAFIYYEKLVLQWKSSEPK